MQYGGGVDADQVAPRSLEKMVPKGQAQEAKVVVVEQALLVPCALKRPVYQHSRAALSPIGDVAELKPALLDAEALRVENIVNIDKCLPGWTNKKECGVDRRVDCMSPKERLLVFEQMIAVLMERGSRVEVDDRLIVDKLEHAQLCSVERCYMWMQRVARLDGR